MAGRSSASVSVSSADGSSCTAAAAAAMGATSIGTASSLSDSDTETVCTPGREAGGGGAGEGERASTAAGRNGGPLRRFSTRAASCSRRLSISPGRRPGSGVRERECKRCRCRRCPRDMGGRADGSEWSRSNNVDSRLGKEGEAAGCTRGSDSARCKGPKSAWEGEACDEPGLEEGTGSSAASAGGGESA